MMDTASKKLLKDPYETPQFYKSKVNTGEFYFAHLLPRADAHAKAMTAPLSKMMKMRDNEFMSSYN